MIYYFSIDKSNILYFDYIIALEEICDFCFYGDTFYLNTSLPSNIIQDKLYGVKLTEIKKNELSDIQSDTIRKWCTDIFLKEELEEFEKTPECQQRLKEINLALDILEKEGGASIGQTKKNNRHRKTRSSSSGKS